MQIPLLVFLREGIFLCGYFSQILAWADPLLYAEYGKSKGLKGGYIVEIDITPLDPDTITRLIYTHDDEITQLVSQLHQLEERIEQLENPETL